MGKGDNQQRYVGEGTVVIESDGPSYTTKILVDGKEIKYIRDFNLRQSFDSEPEIALNVFAPQGLRVEYEKSKIIINVKENCFTQLRAMGFKKEEAEEIAEKIRAGEKKIEMERK
jgi:hypothetical protein